MPATPDRLYQVARKCLDVIEAAYPADGHKLPDRRYVADGVAVYDCEQLCVQVERIYSTQGAVATEVIADANKLGMRAAVIAIVTLRCVPKISNSGKPPSAASIEASSKQTLADPTIQWLALRQAWDAGDLAPFGHGIGFDAWQGIGPEGGLAGGVLRVRWALTAGPVGP